jgi:uncharacterized protein (DUF2141 family)
MRSRPALLLPQLGIVLIALMSFAVLATAAEVRVEVTGIVGEKGALGCSLFGAAGASAFPMDASGARQVWLAADSPRVTCRFVDVPDGTYAVSVAHDLNGNKKIDTNFVGIPTEAWGVSGNVRPTLRAPRFDEAAFRVESGKDVTLHVTVVR